MKTLGPYTLMEELGRGCMGAVYRARRAGLPRDFALKILLDDENDPEGIARFKQEAQLASKLEDRGVVGVFDVGEANGTHYYVMEYCPGRTLEEKLTSEGRSSEKEAAKLVAQLARTVHAAHEQGVIHRDLKPANIIIEEGSGRPRITDFGLARDLSRLRSLTQSGDVLGTPYYMAPEQFRGKADARTDVWGLGVILYEALAGRRPFEGSNFTEVSESVRYDDPPLIREFAPEVSDAIEAVVFYALAKDPANRYLSAQALVDDLEAVLRGETPSHASGILASAPRGPFLKIVFGAFLVSALVIGTYAGLEHRRRARISAEREAQAEQERARAQAQERLAAALEEARQIAWPADAELPECLAAFDRADELTQARSPEAHAVALARARLLLRRGRPREAADVAYPLRGEEPPVGLDALRIAAEAHEALGQRKEARQLHEELTHADPSGAHGLAAAAALCRLAWNAPGTIEASAKAYRAFPTHPAVQQERALGLVTEGAARNAPMLRALLEAISAHSPPSPRLLACEGMLEASTANVPRALELLDTAVRMSGEHPEPSVLRARARIYVEQGDLDRALADGERALKVDPHNPPARFVFGRTLWQKSQVAWEDPTWADRAREQWREAFADGPELFQGFLNATTDPRLRAAVQRAVSPKAPSDPWAFELTGPMRRKLARRAQEARPPARKPLLRAMLRAANGGSWVEVDRLYGQAEQASPGCPIVALERARICVGREAYAEATANIERARRLGADPDVLDFLEAENYWLLGRAYEAAPRFEAIVKRRPQGSVGLCARANWLFAHERGDLAIKAAQRAVNEDPEHVPSLVIKARLLLATFPPQLDMTQRVCEQGLALEGAMNLRLVRARLSVLELRAFFDRGGRQRQNIDPKLMRPVLEAYERLFPLSPGTGLLLDAAQNLLRIKGPHPWRSRVAGWIEESTRRLPQLGLNYTLLGTYELQNEGSKEEILTAWRKARELEPRIFFSEVTLQEFRERFGPSPELEEFTSRAQPEPVPSQPEED